MFVYFSYLEDKSASQYFPLAHVIFVRHLSYVVIREGTCELCSNNCKYLLTMTDMRGHSWWSAGQKMETINIIKYCCPEKTERLEGSTHLLVCLFVFLFALILEAKIGFSSRWAVSTVLLALNISLLGLYQCPQFFFLWFFFKISLTWDSVHVINRSVITASSAELEYH